MNRVEQMKIIHDEALEVFKQKNTDYGDSFKQFGMIGLLTRIQDKINRCLTITKNGIHLVDDESLKDTLLDLHNYTAIALMVDKYD